MILFICILFIEATRALHTQKLTSLQYDENCELCEITLKIKNSTYDFNNKIVNKIFNAANRISKFKRFDII